MRGGDVGRISNRDARRTEWIPVQQYLCPISVVHLQVSSSLQENHYNTNEFCVYRGDFCSDKNRNTNEGI